MSVLLSGSRVLLLRTGGVPPPIPAVVLQNVTNKSYMVSDESEKRPFLVIFRVLGSMRPGKAEIHSPHY